LIGVGAVANASSFRESGEWAQRAVLCCAKKLSGATDAKTFPLGSVVRVAEFSPTLTVTAMDAGKQQWFQVLHPKRDLQLMLRAKGGSGGGGGGGGIIGGGNGAGEEDEDDDEEVGHGAGSGGVGYSDGGGNYDTTDVVDMLTAMVEFVRVEEEEMDLGGVGGVGVMGGVGGVGGVPVSSSQPAVPLADPQPAVPIAKAATVKAANVKAAKPVKGWKKRLSMMGGQKKPALEIAGLPVGNSRRDFTMAPRCCDTHVYCYTQGAVTIMCTATPKVL
jgi:hypothetical protein